MPGFRFFSRRKQRGIPNEPLEKVGGNEEDEPPHTLPRPVQQPQTPPPQLSIPESAREALQDGSNARFHETDGHDANPDSQTPTATESWSSPSRGTRDSLWASATDLTDMKCDLMVNYLRQQQEERLWAGQNADNGVVLKQARNQYACCPTSLGERDDGFFNSVRLLNVRVSIPRLS